MRIKRLIVGELAANCYILKSGDELCIIDPGADIDSIIAAADKLGGQLKYIICTHYHEDHTAEAVSLQSVLGGEILIHKEELSYINFQVNKYLAEGDIVNLGEINLRVLHTPGHSPGSICLLLDKYIFTGDTVFLNGCGRFDLLGGDERDLEESLLRLSEIIVPGMEVLAGHGESFLFKN